MRIASTLKEQIQALVDIGEYRDITDFVTKAIRNQLDNEPFEKYDKIKMAFEDILNDRDDDFIQATIHTVIKDNMKLYLLQLLDDNDIQEKIKEL